MAYSRSMARKNLSAHITTSTFGVGSDFDEDLMKSMAESGGGNSFYIEEPEHSEAVFSEELEYMRGLVATDCTVTFKGATGVQFHAAQQLRRDGEQFLAHRRHLDGRGAFAGART